MNPLSEVTHWLRITRAHAILRRYFVVNGFDGGLTMLGLIIGFLVSEPMDLSVTINACLGAAIALGMSGLGSAYVSEAAERAHALGELEKAMLSDLQKSDHGKAARIVPLLVSLVNGLAPLVISLLILVPLWLAKAGFTLPIPPLHSAIVVALVLIFMLGIFVGRIAGVSWLRSGIRTMLVAVATSGLIYLFAGE